MISREKKDIVGKHNIIVLDLDSGERIHLQGLPMELNVNPESSFAVVKPFGRNNPHYHFTGSEDTLSMSISWYAEREDLSDVMEKCKWLESLTKADGYFGRPHLVALIWGDLYKSHTWIVSSAPYKLTHFNGEQGYRPLFATQELVLKRVTEQNLTLREVLRYD